MEEVANSGERWKVLVVGNNPIELGPVFEQLQGIRHKRVLTEIAFDLRTILQRLIWFRPQHIIIDDNIGDHELHAMVTRLQKRRTRHVPITVIKNSNYHEAIGSGVMNYVLKKNLSSELLYKELLNSLHFFKTQKYWDKAYRKRKGQLKRFLKVWWIKSGFPAR